MVGISSIGCKVYGFSSFMYYYCDVCMYVCMYIYIYYFFGGDGSAGLAGEGELRVRVFGGLRGFGVSEIGGGGGGVWSS